MKTKLYFILQFIVFLKLIRTEDQICNIAAIKETSYYSCHITGAKLLEAEETVLTILNTDNLNFTLDYKDVKVLVYGDGNEITFIPSTVFFVFPSMEEFSIPGPNLEFSVLNTENFVDASNLKKLRIENTAVSQLSANLFVHAPILQKIILKNNWIDDVDQLAFKGLNQLQEISLSGNRIKYLHAEVFSGLKSLVGLQLIKNICINKSFYIDEGNLNEVEDEIKRSCAHQEVQFKARIFESNTTKHNHLNFNETLYEILEHKSDTIEETIATDKGSTDNDVMAIFITLGVLILILMPSIIIMVSLINNREPPISQTPRPSVPQIIMEDILLKDMEDPLAFY